MVYYGLLSQLCGFHLNIPLEYVESCFFNPAALLRLRGRAENVFAELEEMKEEAAHTQSSVTIQDFFKKRSYRQPIIIVLIVSLGSQLSGFNAVSDKILLIWKIFLWHISLFLCVEIDEVKAPGLNFSLTFFLGVMLW